MKLSLIVRLAWVGALVSGGCAASQQGPETGPATGRAKTDGLVLRLSLDRTEVLVGEQVEATVTARNTGEQPRRIEARTGALVYLRVWGYDGINWIEEKQYPQAATMVLTPWTLEPGRTRTWTFTLPVEPDWPTYQRARITAELNGVPELLAAVPIEVRRPAGRGS